MSETLIVLRSRSLRGRPFADDHAAAENVHAKAYKKIRNRDEQWERVMADVSMQLHVDALLRKACRDGNFARTEECLAAGANAVAYDEAYERNALHHAAVSQTGDVRIAQALLASGAPIEGRDQFNSTALHLAAERGHLAFVDHLLKQGKASVNPRSSNGSVALHYAVCNGHFDVANTLLVAMVSQGMIPISGEEAYSAFKDHAGNTPLDVAHAMGHKKIADMLMRAATPSRKTLTDEQKEYFAKRAMQHEKDKRKPDGHQQSAFFTKCGANENVATHKQLKFGSKRLDDEDLRVFSYIASEGRFPYVKELNLSGNHIADEGFADLSHAIMNGALATVENLILSANALDDDAFQSLSVACYTNGRLLPCIKVLDLSDNFLTDEGVEMWCQSIAMSGALSTLRALKLGTNLFGPGILGSIARCAQEGGFKGLRELGLSNNAVGDDGIRDAFPQVVLNAKRKTKMTGKDSMEAAKAAVARGKAFLGSIENLQLNNNRIGSAGLSSLAEACKRVGTTALKQLWLGGNEIGDTGVNSLVSAITASALPKLEVMLLYSNALGDTATQSLGRAGREGKLNNMRFLCLQDNKVPRKAKIELRMEMSAAVPELSVFAG